MRRVLPALLTSLLAVGCAATGPRSRGKGPGTVHRVFGTVAFEAEHFALASGAAPPSSSLVPRGHQPLQRLRICLIAQSQRNDLRAKHYLENDEVVGCATVGADGQYEITVPMKDCPRSGDCWADYYLATDLCVWSDDRAEACISLDTDLGRSWRQQPWTKPATWRKWMWTGTERVSLTDRTSTAWSWNLSCPRESGRSQKAVRCARPDAPGRAGWTHSNIGFNSEAVHALAAASMVVERFGSLAPNAKNTGRSDFCGSKQDRARDHWMCQDTVRIVLRRARRLGMPKRACGKAPGSQYDDYAPTTRTVCLVSPNNPYVVAHEIGHILHRRWMGVISRLSIPDRPPPSWRQGTDQKANLVEGWANFVSAATWHLPTDRQPFFDRFPIEESPACSPSPQTSEAWPTRFFWDLYDAMDSREPGDKIQLTAGAILKIWAAFPGSEAPSKTDRSIGECDPHGRNAYDYAHHLLRMLEVDAEPLLTLNCLQGSVRSIACGG